MNSTRDHDKCDNLQDFVSWARRSDPWNLQQCDLCRRLCGFAKLGFPDEIARDAL